MIPENADTRLMADCHPRLVLPSSDTPETDQKTSNIIGFFSCATVPASFAQNLERERTDIREMYNGLMVDHQIFADKLNDAISALMTIEERYIDGCDTYEDWKFMGDAARKFLSEND